VGVTAGSIQVPGRKPVTRDNSDDDDGDILGGNFPTAFLTDIFTSGYLHTPLTTTFLI
jgi:hypothetical protein